MGAHHQSAKSSHMQIKINDAYTEVTGTCTIVNAAVRPYVVGIRHKSRPTQAACSDDQGGRVYYPHHGQLIMGSNFYRTARQLFHLSNGN